jgi:hypothetical protein
VNPLFQHLILLLPHRPDSITLVIAMVGLLAGVSLWIAGARFSQSILTLAAVALGTSIGMKLPVWCKWQIDPMAPAVAGAIVLGVSAYIFHRVWAGIWLGVVQWVWTTFVLWATRGPAFHWRVPQYGPGETLPQYFANFWQNVPDTMQQCLGFVAAAAMLVGISAALLWPRVGMALLWSAAGISLVLPAAATALSKLDPQALRHMPRETPDQLALLAGLVGMGAIIQWRTSTEEKAAAPAGAGKKKSDSHAAD